MMALRFATFMALLACIAGMIFHLTVSRDAEAIVALALGATIAVITLVAARPRKGNR